MNNIHKNVIYLGWVSFFTDLSSSIVTTLLPIFIVYTLHESVEKLGIVIAVATFVSYALRIVFGYLSDRYQIVKPFVVAGYFISAVTKPLLMFSHTYTSVAALRAGERLGKAVRSASKDSLISSYAQKGSSGKTFGFHKMMDVSGEMCGAIIIMIFFYFTMQNETLIRELFGLTLIPGLIATLIVVVFVQDAPKKPLKEKKVLHKEDYKLFWVIGSYFLFLFFFISDQYFILQAKDGGITLMFIPLLVILSTFTQALTSYVSGGLIDRFGTLVMLLFAYIFAVAALVILQFHYFYAAFVFFGLFTVVSLNTLRAYIASQAKSKGFVYGLFYGGIAVFSALGALVMGYVWKIFGMQSMMHLSIVGTSSILCMLLIYMLAQKMGFLNYK